MGSHFSRTLHFFPPIPLKKRSWSCFTFGTCESGIISFFFFLSHVLTSEGEMRTEWRSFDTSSKAKEFHSLHPQ